MRWWPFKPRQDIAAAVIAELRSFTQGADMSTPNPIVTAATPELIAVLQAILQFNANIGVNPAQWPLTVPGALTVLLGTVQLQVPALASAEAGAVVAEVNAKISAWIASLQAKSKA
jgi:hypothetical protein